MIDAATEVPILTNDVTLSVTVLPLPLPRDEISPLILSYLVFSWVAVSAREAKEAPMLLANDIKLVEGADASSPTSKSGMLEDISFKGGRSKFIILVG